MPAGAELAIGPRRPVGGVTRWKQAQKTSCRTHRGTEPDLEETVAGHKPEEEDGDDAEGACRELDRLLGTIATLFGDTCVYGLREKALVVGLAADFRQLWRLWRLLHGQHGIRDIHAWLAAVMPPG